MTAIDLHDKKVVAEVPVGVEPEGVGISPDGKTLIATSETSNMAHFIDTGTYQIVDNVLVGSRPRYAEFSADGSQLWVTSEVAGTVSVIDPKTRQIVKTIGFEIPGVQPENMQPVGVRLLKDGSKAFVALGPGQSHRGRQCEDARGRALSPRRPAGVAARADPRRQAAIHAPTATATTSPSSTCRA